MAKFFFLEIGAIVGFVEHTPLVDLDGPAFLVATFGDGKIVKPFIEDLSHKSMVNPAGLPLSKGEKNVLFLHCHFLGKFSDEALFLFLEKLKPGDPISIKLEVFALNINEITLIGDTTITLMKPDFKGAPLVLDEDSELLADEDESKLEYESALAPEKGGGKGGKGGKGKGGKGKGGKGKGGKGKGGKGGKGGKLEMEEDEMTD
eukprot:CAMPEP_0182428554 /NCGR_PEP_ID=MMETSP1167-20130531/23109_1 /TAXON_ID=2988 /ORGANISM="Mallomonas Sp, Strain CCMP3275" /LENGTH=203 /DNA_ID=CAMNT_0024611517 /DNA_START=212 /DNA_END=823 /DNA_ORIENTATION=+